MDTPLKKQGIGMDLVEGPILKTLLIFAIPIILTNLIQQLCSTVGLIIIVAAVVNIVFDVLLVAVFDLQAAGTAIATVASQAGSFQTMVTGSGFVSLGFAIGILDGVVCRIGFSLLFLHVFHQGAVSYFWGTALSRTLPAVICFAYFISGKWRTRKLLSDE